MMLSDRAVDRLINEAVAAEREACAKIAEEWRSPTQLAKSTAGDFIAAAIRARTP